MAKIDLDAKRAERAKARAEKGIEDPSVTIGGETFDLPPELPYEAAEAINANDDHAFLAALFGENYQAVVDKGLSVSDIETLTTELLLAYGMVRRPDAPETLSESVPSPNGNGTRGRAAQD